MTATGNTRLVEYGIQTEGSNYRAHVCILAKALYVYRTVDGVRCATDPRFREGEAPTGNIITAKGRLVPPHAIASCMRTDIPPHILTKNMILRTDHPTVKGRRATYIVAAMMQEGYFPLILDPRIEPEGSAIQIKGIDIIATADLRIQVKCDFRGGEKKCDPNNPEITGNLFLQTAECNPYGAH